MIKIQGEVRCHVAKAGLVFVYLHLLHGKSQIFLMTTYLCHKMGYKHKRVSA